jgi:hypothetical protein
MLVTLDDSSMPKTQRLIVACLALATGIGVGWLFALLFTFDTSYVPPPTPITTTTNQKQQEIYAALKFQLETKGVKTDGLSPYLLLEHFPPVEESDFNGVEAIIGQYEITDNTLTYKSGETVGNAAASDMSDAGFALFLKNYSSRTGLDISAVSAVDVAAHISGSAGVPSPDTDTSGGKFTACTLDAKLCPDGSYVGRTGPNCEFAACPSDTAVSKTITCTPEQKQAEACIEIYQPVCASVQIQCVTTPCEPIEKTFGNSCEACSETSVTEYTEGACATL